MLSRMLIRDVNARSVHACRAQRGRAQPDNVCAGAGAFCRGSAKLAACKALAPSAPKRRLRDGSILFTMNLHRFGPHELPARRERVVSI